MLTPLSRLAVALALTSSIFGAAIPTMTTTATYVAEPHHGEGPNIYSSEAPAPTPTAQGRLAASRRSGELWEGIEHEEITSASSTPSRRSGELWEGIEHEEIVSATSAPSRRSGELWEGIEHQEIVSASLTLSRRSGELWKGIEHAEVSPQSANV